MILLIATLVVSCSSSLPGQGDGTPNPPFLPVVVATTAEPTNADRDLQLARSAKDVETVSKDGDYVFRRFERFQLAYHKNTLGLEDARKATEILGICQRLLNAKSKTFALSSLSADEQKLVRGQVSGESEGRARAAAAPNLKVTMGVCAHVQAQQGPKVADLWVKPDGPRLKDLPNFWTDDSNRPANVPKPPSDGQIRPTETKTLTFLYPADRAPGVERLKWTKEIQDYLLRLCEEARLAFESRQKALVDTLKPNDPLFENSDPRKRLGDLSTDRQHDLLQDFATGRDRNLFATANDAESFLVNAQLSSQCEFCLTAYMLNESHPTWSSTLVVTVPISCPVGP